MKTQYLFLLTLALFVFLNQSISAQNNNKNKTVTITTVEGNIYTGKILKQTKKTIRIKTISAGAITLKKEFIKSIDFDNKSEKNTSKYKSYPSKYLVGTSGYNLKKGEGYYNNTWIFFNEINYGITDYLSIGAGIIPTFIIGKELLGPVWLKAKISYPIIKNKINVCGGAMAGTILGERLGLENTPLYLYSAGTFGPKDKNITIGINYGVIKGLWSPALFTISGKYKVSSRTILLTDNYFSFNRDALGSGLISFLGARTAFRGISLDYAFIIPIGYDSIDRGLPLFPYLGIKIGF